MNCGEDDSSPCTNSYRNGPYSSSIASSASSSSASVWSDASSQSSDDSCTFPSDLETSETYCSTTQEHGTTAATYWPKQRNAVDVAPEQRQHPRRTSVGTQGRAACPPSLVRQCDRKVTFVDGLVDTSTQMVETIWPLSSVPCRSEPGSDGGPVIPLRFFIQETLRRSRTSYSTLQVALYYLILIRPHVPTHDFTMEQPSDSIQCRALQCGRRMFLAALVLASKYLQDRNYSARAWSKISGLSVQEINSNEIAFLLAVNWELHITDKVFKLWADIVLKYTPSPSSSPGAGSSHLSEQSAEWKAIILRLNPELDNIEDASPSASVVANVKCSTRTHMRYHVPSTTDRSSLGYGSKESRYSTPSVLEPSPYPPTNRAPALGLLPTPRLTPQTSMSGLNTPAVSAVSGMLSKSSMSYAMSQVSNACAAQLSEKWQHQYTSSPQSYVSQRRSSLANSVSSMSSPESMVSDSSSRSSRSSRSSSISSASSVTAPISSKLDVQARCRYAKLCSERQNRMYIATLAEDYCDNGPTSSPESYTGPVGKDLYDLTLENPLGQYLSKDEEAARALQELHNHPRSSESPIRTSAKRSRPQSMDNTLQENVREMLSGRYQPYQTNWSDDYMKNASRETVNARSHISARPFSKRVCCATEAAREIPTSNLHPAFGGHGGPGMWRDILN